MKKGRFFLIIISLLLLTFIALDFEYNYLQIEADVTTKFLIIFLFNFSIISLLTLIFFVGKNLFKLWIEKKRKITGYKFRTKLVITFVILTLVPSSMLFLVASEIVTNYIDRWFDPQIESPLRDAVELSKTFYEIERERTISKARKVIRGEIFRDNITVNILKSLPDNPSETIRDAFKGKEGTEVITRKDADVIRAVIPEIVSGKVKRVFVAESLVPPGIVKRIENIKRAQGTYESMKKLKTPLKMNYLLVLAFFTSMIVFMAMWVSLRISRRITEPISSLADATKDIAAGNLDVNIDIERDDEIGMLVSSFNNMVAELRDSKTSLENAYIEADRRRVCMESIVENVETGVISIDDNGKIQAINNSACRILGIDSSLFWNKNKDYDFLLSMVESEELKQFIMSLDLRDSKTVREQISVHIGGKKLILRLFITRLTFPDGKPIGLLVVFDDLTDVIRAEQALTWQEIARRIAHEIKNPLTPIRLSAERIMKKWSRKDEGLDETIGKATATIIREVEELRRLVDEFTKFGRMPKIRMEKVNIGNILSEVADMYGDYTDIRIGLDLPDNIPDQMLDPEQIKRVVVNLFNNAINAMEEKGEILVTGKFNGKGDKLILEFADTGTGIDQKDLDKLFVPYFSTNKNGTGLGLAISHMIISRHGGSMGVTNNKPGGAVFTIELPV
ncbi:alginate biosynthesis sensor protein KinB [bacterium BMS3Abin07]|nr:alginate biosynthesis sensor protein KinB [bacterium BMS3Abin07]GBE33101.1 alginate biosynthesis sensor protein KinB [bacterium BMS3Bbin05]HDO21801.1 HAMP domain-containing protein [Nitrospirota bacterium]HDZ88771.1 HAMP domain-containing protein [Nitrospirota bacterium]